MRYLPLLLCAALAGCNEPTPSGTAGKDAAGSTSTHVFRCESGRSIEVSYPDTDSAIVVYEGRTFRMKIAVSASGARYVGEGMEWWSKGAGPGAEGSLFRADSEAGGSGDALELCREVAGR